MEKNQNIRAEFASTNLKRKNPTSFSSLDNSFDDENNDSKILKIDMGCNSNGYHGDDQVDVVLPVGFLDPLPPLERELVNASRSARINIETTTSNTSTRKQFWKAGDYEPSQALVPHASSSSNFAGMDHVRVHPRFLHSNATSHKWVLGALAELLDNALDEVSDNGATYVSIDMVINEKDRNKMSIVDKDRNRMLVVQDDGGGMNPSELRSCMSLGYSAKSKMANTIGQYGNGFKTSTMRLGSDVIVFSLCRGKNGSCATRSIGMLSYTFLTSTGKEDIVVPMIDYEKKGEVWIKKLSRTLDDWHVNLESIINWSPFLSEQDLLQEFNSLGDQGTKIVIYNLWEDDNQQLELDFDTDIEDIQIRGVNRDEKKIAMARKYPNSKHYLTYQHSLRSYASILYLRLPPGFRIILRGKDVLHHNLIDDMIHKKEQTYRPVLTTEGTEKDLNPSTDMQAFVTMGFVKDAQDHMDIQGFNVYHKNRLIKPFWRVWNAAGSDGRGVIGVLEANFVSPAHDKQGFERTTTLQRLEARLIHMQKSYWRDNCHEIGYAPRRSVNKASSTAASPQPIKGSTTKGTSANKTDANSRRNCIKNFDQVSPFVESSSEEEMTSNGFESPPPINESRHSHSNIKINGNMHTSPKTKEDVVKLREENLILKKRLEDAGESRNNLMQELQLERDRCKSLEAQLDKANNKAAETDKEQEALIQIFAEERERRNNEEEYLRQRLQEASTTIEQLVDKVKTLEKMKIRGCKPEIY